MLSFLRLIVLIITISPILRASISENEEQDFCPQLLTVVLSLWLCGHHSHRRSYYRNGASWAYEEYWSNILNEIESGSSTGVSNQAVVPAVILASGGECLTFVDSVGYYHNMLLAEIAKSGKKYLDDSGKVNIEELFADITAMLDEKKQACSGAPNPGELAVFSSSVATFINTLESTNERTLDKSFAIFESKSEALGLPVKEFGSIKEMCNKISNVIPYLENEKIVEYGEKRYKVIDNSNISEGQKQSFKILDNIIVNSKPYWTTTR